MKNSKDEFSIRNPDIPNTQLLIFVKQLQDSLVTVKYQAADKKQMLRLTENINASENRCIQ